MDMFNKLYDSVKSKYSVQEMVLNYKKIISIPDKLKPAFVILNDLFTKLKDLTTQNIKPSKFINKLIELSNWNLSDSKLT